jgi:hypothetical protein
VVRDELRKSVYELRERIRTHLREQLILLLARSIWLQRDFERVVLYIRTHVYMSTCTKILLYSNNVCKLHSMNIR